MNHVVYKNIPCPVLKFDEPDSYLVLFKGEFKWIYKYSLGYGEIIKYRNGDTFYKNKKCQFHREKEPAVIYFDGSKFWYKEHEYHRLDGPAVIWSNGNKEYWINNRKMSENEFNQIVKNNEK